MGQFGEFLSDADATWFQETPAFSLSKLGGPGGTNVSIGANSTPAVLLNNSAQSLAGRIVAPVGWDTSVDCLAVVGIALNGAQANLDTFTIEYDYQYVEGGTAALADFNKTVTSESKVLTVTTAEGLADETLYTVSFPLDRLDADNPYDTAIGGLGGFTYQANIAAGSSITSMYILAIGILYPVVGVEFGPSNNITAL